MTRLKALFDRFRPVVWRQVRTLPEEQLVAALAGIDDHSPQLAALVDQLHGQFETNVLLALNFHETAEKRLRACDRAGALKDTIELLEFNRAEAKERQRREAELRQEQKKV